MTVGGFGVGLRKEYKLVVVEVVLEVVGAGVTKIEEEEEAAAEGKASV